MVKKHIRSIIRNSAWSFGEQFVGLIIGFIVSPLVSRLLPPESRGIFTLSFLIPGMVTQFIVLGIPSANIYFFSAKKINGDILDKVNFCLGTILSIIGVIINLALGFCLRESFYKDIPFEYILISTISVPAGIYSSFFLSSLTARQLFKKAAVFTIIINVVNLILTISIFLYHKNALLLLILLSVAISILNLLIIIIVTKPRILQNHSSISEYSRVAFKYGIPAHLSNVVTFLNYRSDQFLVSSILNNSSLGLYSVAVSLSEKLWMFSSTVSNVAFPKLSELTNERYTQNKMTLLLARWIFIASFLGALVMSVIFPIYIRYAHGLNYITSIPLFQIMLPGIVMWAVGRIFANSIASIGKTKPNLYIALVTFLINFSLNLILLPSLGIKGASIATLVAYSTDAVLKAYFYLKITDQRFGDLLKLLPEEKQLFTHLKENFISSLCKCLNNR